MYKVISLLIALLLLSVNSQTLPCTTHCKIQPVNAPAECLDVTDGSLLNGTTIQIWTCANNPQQYFSFNTQPTGNYTITSDNSHLCFDVTDNSQSNGAVLQQWACDGLPQQVFRFAAAGAGSPGDFNIIEVASGKCLDVTDALTTNSARIQQYECNGLSNQLFTIVQG